MSVLIPRSAAVVLSIALHGSFVALAVASPRHVSSKAASEPIEVSLDSALPRETEPSAPAPSAPLSIATHAAPAPAQVKALPASAAGAQTLAESSPAVGVEEAPHDVEPVAFHFALGAISSQAGVASPNIGTSLAGSAVGVAVSVPTGPLSESDVSTRAALRSGGPPSYTAAAAAAGIEAELPFELVVDDAGLVRSARPLAHVGYGLDEAAAVAVRNYRFSPAQRGHRPVAVRMRWVVRFQLR